MTAPTSPRSLGPGTGRPETHGRQAIYLLLLVAVNLALFLPSMSGDFLWDDKYFISENPNIQGSEFLRSFLSSPFGGFSGTDENSRRQDRVMQFYRPLVSLSYWLDFKAWGLNPAAFHLSNILIHTVNAILLFYILIGLTLRPLSSFLGALLFSSYPLHFENVSWISGRTDLLAFLFGGLSVLFFIRFAKKRAGPALAFSGAAYFLALLCKESVLLLPVMALLFFFNEKRKATDALSRIWPYAVAFLGWLGLRLSALGAFPFGRSGRTLADLLAAIGFYTWKLITPFHLSLTVDPRPILKNPAFRLLGAALAVFAVLCARQALRKAPERGGVYWAFLAYSLFLLPSAVLIFSPAAISLLAWRFLYLPSAILLGAVAYFLGRRLRLRAGSVGFMIVLSAVYTAEIYPKNKLYGKDETGFWLSLKRPEREDALARFNVGVKALPTDEKTALRLFDEILGQPDHPLYPMLRIRIYEELAIYYTLKKDFRKAESYFSDLLKTGESQSLHFYFNYSFYLALSGKRQEGERLILSLLRQFPRNHNVLLQAAKFYLILRDYGAAAKLYGEDYRLFRSRQSAALAEEAERLSRAR